MPLPATLLVQAKGDQLENIRKAINEDLNTRNQDLEAIKDWLRKQPHLPNEWEDACLLNFLRGCSFSMEKCKRKLDMYFTMRTACPDLFTNRDITRPELEILMTKAQNISMPHLTPEGRRIVVCRALTSELETRRMREAFKIILMSADIRLREETGVEGLVYIFDADIVQASHLGSISFLDIKKFLICAQEAYPIKPKQVHIVNASKLADTIYSMVKPFLKEKIKNRIFFHKDYKGLHKFIPLDVLPPEYGGTSHTLVEMTQAWFDKLKEYKDWFLEQESLKANESLRLGQPKNYDELFGMDGSFRQLAID